MARQGGAKTPQRREPVRLRPQVMLRRSSAFAPCEGQNGSKPDFSDSKRKSGRRMALHYRLVCFLRSF